MRGPGNHDGVRRLPALVFTTVSATASVDPRLGLDCTPAASAAAKPRPRLLARRVQAARRSSGSWSKGSPGPRVRYPKARLCGSTICVKRHAGAAWAPLTGR